MALVSAPEWIKGLLAVPFVLYSQPTGVFGDDNNVAKMAEEAHRRYAEIMRDVELMIDDHSKATTSLFFSWLFGGGSLYADCILPYKQNSCPPKP